VERNEFVDYNDWIYDKKFVLEAGDSTKLKPGALVTLRQIREENSFLKRNDKKLVEYRDAMSSHGSFHVVGYHESFAWYGIVDFGGIVPGDHQGAFYRRHRCQERLPDGLERERYRGQENPGGYRYAQYDRLQVTGSGRPPEEVPRSWRFFQAA
jgi:hypothetical protein